MAIFIKTKDPKELLGLIRSQIDNDIIKYWVYDLDGDITCIREELLGKAWLHPYLLDGFLAFGIMGRKMFSCLLIPILFIMVNLLKFC